MSIKGMLSGLPISKQTQKAIEDGLVASLGEKADQIKTVSDLKKAVMESLSKIPVLDAKGILYAKSLDELAKKVFGDKFDIADDIANAIADQMIPAADALDGVADVLKDAAKNSMFSDDEKRIAESNLLERQDSMVELLGSLLVLGKDQYAQMLEQAKLLRQGVASNIGGGLLGGAGNLLGAIGGAASSFFGKNSVKTFMKFGGAIALATDALEGIADPTLQGNSIASRGMAAAITGGTNGTVTGNALKGAMLGGVIAGPLGILVGGALGAAASFIDTKWLADKIDSAFDFLTDVFDWQKIKDVVWNLPQTIDDMGVKLWESVKNITSAVWDFLSAPFSFDFWKGVGNFYLESWSSHASLMGGLAKSLSGPIFDFLSAPFSKDFWHNGKNGILDIHGDIGGQIADAIGTKIVDVRDSIISYLDPSNWLPDWMSSSEAASSFAGEGANTNGSFEGFDSFQDYSVQPNRSQSISDIEATDKEAAKIAYARQIKDLGKAYNIATSSVIQNNANVQINNRQPMGPSATHSRIFGQSYGR
jgi:hypothetical protein